MRKPMNFALPLDVSLRAGLGARSGSGLRLLSSLQGAARTTITVTAGSLVYIAICTGRAVSSRNGH